MPGNTYGGQGRMRADWDNVVECLQKYKTNFMKIEEAIFICQTHKLTLSHAKSMKGSWLDKARKRNV